MSASVAQDEVRLAASSLLQLMWLASPALPVGGFSYSEGLEAAVDRAEVATESIASDWLHDQLTLSLTRADLAVVARAVEAWRQGDTVKLKGLSDWILQTRETSEFRAQTEQMGRSLLDWLRNDASALGPYMAGRIETCAELPPTYPLVFALAASGTDASVRDCLLAYAFGWAENMMQAALKSVPLGQSAGQRILARLSRAIPGAVELAMQLPDDQRQAFSPMLAILSAQHETQYSRLFRS